MCPNASQHTVHECPACNTTHEERLQIEALKTGLAAQPHQIITIEHQSDDTFGWIVRSGDGYEDHLGPDEALWLIARLLMGSTSALRTTEQHEQFDRWMKGNPSPPLEPWEKQLTTGGENSDVTTAK